MATYSDTLAVERKLLKRNAIDAYMRSEGYRLMGDSRYSNYSYGSVETGISESVTRPGPDGEGGGVWTRENGITEGRDLGDDYKDAFDNVRARIDVALDPWEYLPDPTEIESLVESMRQANRTLKISPAVAEGATTGGGNLMASALVGLNQNADSMSGATIGTFKLNFMNQLGTCVGGLHAITVVLGAALAAEHGLWVESRKSVAAIIEAATEAFEDAAKEDGTDWELTFKVVGWALAGASIFATGGATTALAVSTLGLQVLEGTVGDGLKADKPGDDFEGVMTKFEDAFAKLNDGIVEEETALADNLTTNHENIYNDKGSYDLGTPNVLSLSDDSQAEIVVIEPALVDEITDQYLPAVGTEAGTAQTKVDESLNIPAFGRDPRVGTGSRGPMWTWADIQFTLKDLLADLSWETTNAATSLRLAVDDIGQTDTSAQDDFEQHAADVSGGSGVDPWDLPPEE